MRKISKITVKHILDEFPDTSFIGEYTDNLEDGVIVREFDKFYEDLTEEELENIPSRGREFRCFKPYSGGENPGTEDYKKYGFQDYQRMEQLNRGHFCFIGIKAEAEILTSQNNGQSWLINSFSSGGLWGIESDSDKSYIEDVEKEQIEELFSELKEIGFTEEDFQNVKIEYKRF